ncbi:hypothetical protein XENTR_v10006417 [Xenopus tropicalis]|nr:hypothetical protein XENTR_v10006417 [Xenopus tropicalis]
MRYILIDLNLSSSSTNNYFDANNFFLDIIQFSQHLDQPISLREKLTRLSQLSAFSHWLGSSITEILSEGIECNPVSSDFHA